MCINTLIHLNTNLNVLYGKPNTFNVLCNVLYGKQHVLWNVLYETVDGSNTYQRHLRYDYECLFPCRSLWLTKRMGQKKRTSARPESLGLGLRLGFGLGLRRCRFLLCSCRRGGGQTTPKKTTQKKTWPFELYMKPFEPNARTSL